MTEFSLGVPATIVHPIDTVAKAPQGAGDGLWAIARCVTSPARREAFINNHWQQRDTSIRPYIESTDPSGENWLVIPGFGSDCGESGAKHLQQYLAPESSISFADISPGGTQKDELKALLAVTLEARRSKRVSGLLHSMGLPRFLTALRDTDVEVDRMVAVSAPGTWRSMRYGRLVMTAGYALDKTSYRGGPGIKYSVALLKQFDRHGFWPLGDRFRAAHHDTITGTSPRRHPNEVVELWEYGKTGFLRNWRAWEGKITSETHVAYCHAEDPARDRSVHVLRAAEELGEFFHNLGAQFEVFPVPNANHGNTDRSLKAVAETGWFNRSQNEQVA